MVARFATLRRQRAWAFLCLSTLATLANGADAPTDFNIVKLIAVGEIEDARTVYETFSPSPLDWLFFEARVAKAEGRYKDAIGIFRNVLQRDPTYLPARRELAHTLFLVKDYRGSTHHFEDLLRNDPDTDQRRGYVHFLDEISRVRPFSLSGSVAIISSSNVNRGSSHGTFQPGVPGVPSFDITSRAKPDAGLELALHGQHLWPTTERGIWSLDWTTSTRLFNEREHSSLSLSAQLRYNRTSQTTRWSLGPSLRRVWPQDSDGQTTLGVNGNWERVLDERTSVFLSGSLEYSMFDSEDTDNGPFYWAQTGIATRQLGGILSVGGRATFHRPETSHQRYHGQALFAHFSRSWVGGLQGGLGIEVGQRSYDADFPLAGAPRKDSFYQLSLSARHSAIRIGRFTPNVYCTFGSTHSNIAFYDFDVSECTFSMTTRF